MMREKQPFLKFIAYLQIIGIVLVVFGHSFHELPDSGNGTRIYLYRLLFNVRMPLFTFVSGFLMIYTSLLGNELKRSPGNFVWNKVKRLLLPYFVLSLVTFVPRAALSPMADDVVELSWNSFFLSLFRNDHLVIQYFWFLQMSFLLLCICYLYVYIYKKKRVNDGLALTVLFALFFLMPICNIFSIKWFSINDVARLGVFFVLGMIYCKYADKVNRFLCLDKTFTIFVYAAAWLAIFYFFRNPLIQKLASVFGIMAFVAVAKYLVRSNIKVLDHLIGANYMIFLLSWYFNVLCQQILHHYTDMPWWVYSALSLLCGIYVPWAFYMALKRTSHTKVSKFFLFILGQNTGRK